MDLPLTFHFSIKDIQFLEKEIINKIELWLWNINNNKTISPFHFLNSYLYNLSEFDYKIGNLFFLSYVSPDKNVREACSQFKLKIEEYFSTFFKSEENYKLFLILKKIDTKKKDEDNTKKVINKIFKSFENNGINIKNNEKKNFNKYNNKLLLLENKFTQNIMNDIKVIKYTKNELENIDNTILFEHKVKNDYLFNTTYPDEKIIMKYCSNSSSRKKMNKVFYSVAEENLDILKNILLIRYKISNLFGFKDSVSYFLSYNRLATLNKINNVLNKLIPILQLKAKQEYQNLINISGKKILYDYDISYYSTIYKKKCLDLDDNIIKNYFPSNYSIPAIIKIYADLFNIKITLIKGKENQYWCKDLDLYKVIDIDSKEILGYFYLDLYPRKGKYTHAATFDIQNSYKNENNIRIIPVTAIICNFTPKNKKIGTSLLTLNEIETFCHEFGHALHNIFSNVKYAALSGISMEDDFGETPSQFFENWCYQTEFLIKISQNYITKKPLSEEIIHKIKINKNFNIGLHFLTQILYIKYDLTIHQKPNISKDYLHNLWFKIGQELLPYTFSKNTYPMCRFNHIIGYASGYYGYLWSLIYAYDAFSIFEEKGIFNKSIGLKFRKEILEKGGTLNGKKMLENFLERKTNKKRFLNIFM